METMKRAAATLARKGAGVGLLAVGAVLALPLVPGPGLVIMAAGLALLGYGDQVRDVSRASWKWLRRRLP